MTFYRNVRLPVSFSFQRFISHVDFLNSECHLVIIMAFRELINGKLQVKLHPGQREVIDFMESPEWRDTKILNILAGSQGGKTSFSIHAFLLMMQLNGCWDYGVVSPTNPLMEDKLLPEFLEVFQNMLGAGRYKIAKRVFEFTPSFKEYLWGKKAKDRDVKVFFKQAQNPIESGTWGGCLVDEINHEMFKEMAFDGIQRRVQIPGGQGAGQILANTTPYAMNWYYKRIYKKRDDPNVKARIFNFPSFLNPAYNKQEAERLKLVLRKDKYEMFVEGKFSQPIGKIYSCYDQDTKNTYTKQEIEEIIKPYVTKIYCLSVDFGSMNTVALLWVIVPELGKAFVIGEYKAQPNSDIYNNILEMSAVFEPVGMFVQDKSLFCEDLDSQTNSEGRYRNIYFFATGGNKAEANFRNEYRRHGIPMFPSAIHSVNMGIQRTFTGFKTGMIGIQDDCKRLLTDIENYQNPVDEYTLEVNESIIIDKSKFHFADALRYGASFFMSPENPCHIRGNTEDIFSSLENFENRQRGAKNKVKSNNEEDELTIEYSKLNNNGRIIWQ